MSEKKELTIFINPLIYKDGSEVSCCKFGAKVSSKYMKLFSKLNGKTVKMVCRVNLYDPDSEQDLEGFTLEPVSE